MSESCFPTDLAPAHGPGHCGTVVASRASRAAGSRSQGRWPLRMDCGRRVVGGNPRRHPAEGGPAGGYSHAWSMAAAGVVRRDGVGMGTPHAALCINRGLERRPDRVPGPQRPPSADGGSARPCVPPGRGPTTDRLITTFTHLRAQSRPRRVSPLNFSRGSGSIQRLLWLRGLLTCRSRGRA